MWLLYFHVMLLKKCARTYLDALSIFFTNLLPQIYFILFRSHGFENILYILNKRIKHIYLILLLGILFIQLEDIVKSLVSLKIRCCTFFSNFKVLRSNQCIELIKDSLFTFFYNINVICQCKKYIFSGFPKQYNDAYFISLY